MIAFIIHSSTLLYCYVLCLWQAAYLTLSLAGSNRLPTCQPRRPVFAMATIGTRIAGVPMGDRASPLPLSTTWMPQPSRGLNDQDLALILAVESGAWLYITASSRCGWCRHSFWAPIKTCQHFQGSGRVGKYPQKSGAWDGLTPSYLQCHCLTMKPITGLSGHMSYVRAESAEASDWSLLGDRWGTLAGVS